MSTLLTIKGQGYIRALSAFGAHCQLPRLRPLRTPICGPPWPHLFQQPSSTGGMQPSEVLMAVPTRACVPNTHVPGLRLLPEALPVWQSLIGGLIRRRHRGYRRRWIPGPTRGITEPATHVLKGAAWGGVPPPVIQLALPVDASR